MKAVSTAIAFFQKINLFNHEPRQSPAVCIVRSVATRRFGLNNKNRREPFEWEQVLKFAKAYGVWLQGYCHLVVVTMFVIVFGGMCRYDDEAGLMWRNIRFVADKSAFEIPFDKRKNSQLRQGNTCVRCGCCIGCGFTPAERTDSTSSADSMVGWH
jgi:hypothetical protein